MVIGFQGGNDPADETQADTPATKAFVPQVSALLYEMCESVVHKHVIGKLSTVPKSGDVAKRALTAFKT